MIARHLAAGAALLLAAGAPVLAQQRTIEVAVNSAELVQLDAAPGTVVVANPAIADVVVDGGRRLFVLGKVPGETQLYVLDGQGATMVRAVLAVVPQSARHMNILRGGEESQVYCAPRCVTVGGGEKPGGGLPGLPGAPPAAAPAPPPAPATK